MARVKIHAIRGNDICEGKRDRMEGKKITRRARQEAKLKVKVEQRRENAITRTVDCKQ